MIWAFLAWISESFSLVKNEIIVQTYVQIELECCIVVYSTLHVELKPDSFCIEKYRNTGKRLKKDFFYCKHLCVLYSAAYVSSMFALKEHLMLIISAEIIAVNS